MNKGLSIVQKRLKIFAKKSCLQKPDGTSKLDITHSKCTTIGKQLYYVVNYLNYMLTDFINIS